jgi:hypothetical protein
LSEKESVVRAARGEPVKKLVVVRSGCKQTKHLIRRRSQVHARVRGDEERIGQGGPKGARGGEATRQERERTLKVLKQVRDGFSLVLQQQRLRRIRSSRAAYTQHMARKTGRRSVEAPVGIERSGRTFEQSFE